jgi:hypothetical protein
MRKAQANLILIRQLEAKRNHAWYANYLHLH